jgi:hypothetical protein
MFGASDDDAIELSPLVDEVEVFYRNQWASDRRGTSRFCVGSLIRLMRGTSNTFTSSEIELPVIGWPSAP